VHDGIERLASISGVTLVSAADRIPLTFTSQATIIRLDGSPKSTQFQVKQSNVTPGYFRTLGIPILRGKDFRPSQTGTVIINQLLAERHFPEGDAIGRRIIYGVAPHLLTFEIGAIVANTKYFSLAEDPQEIIYLPLGEEQDTLYLFASTAAPANTMVESIRKSLQKPVSTALIEVNTLRDNLYLTLFPIRIGCTLLTVVGGIGLCLALIGFYSVLSYAVAQRTKEIGIRIALGASQSSVLQLVLSRSLSLVMCGVAVGTLASLGLAKPFRAILGTNVAYNVWSFGLAVTILLGVCFATALLPAYRALHVDPLRAIHYE
jgi:putative ABC transport system permease protein